LARRIPLDKHLHDSRNDPCEDPVTMTVLREPFMVAQ
jgi:hypothetical protein